MRSSEELFKESSSLHNHHCAGQVLGVRMAMVAAAKLLSTSPRDARSSWSMSRSIAVRPMRFKQLQAAPWENAR